MSCQISGEQVCGVSEDLAQALACQFWAPNHKLKGSWRFVQLGHVSRMAVAGLNAGQSIGRKAQARLEELQHLPDALLWSARPPKQLIA